MEKRLRETSRFFVAPRREFTPAVCARPRTPFSINNFTSVHTVPRNNGPLIVRSWQALAAGASSHNLGRNLLWRSVIVAFARNE